MFSTHPKTNFTVSVTFILSSANAFSLGQSTNLSFGKELTRKLLQNSVTPLILKELVGNTEGDAATEPDLRNFSNSFASIHHEI